MNRGRVRHMCLGCRPHRTARRYRRVIMELAPSICITRFRPEPTPKETDRPGLVGLFLHVLTVGSPVRNHIPAETQMDQATPRRCHAKAAPASTMLSAPRTSATGALPSDQNGRYLIVLVYRPQSGSHMRCANASSLIGKKEWIG